MTLRHRLTRQAAWAIVALVLGFGALSWAVTAAHLYAVSRAQALVAAEALADRHAAQVPRYRYRGDPAVWLRVGAASARSPNAAGAMPPRPGFHHLLGRRPALVVTARQGSRVAVVSWPLAADLDVMRDLLLVLALVGVLSGAVAWWLARWATGRMLVPVDRMTRAVEAMVSGSAVAALPEWPDHGTGASDEFNHLSRVFNKLLAALSAQAEREREMLREVAHEIRTPLQVLRGNLDVMSEAADAGSEGVALRQESLDQSRQVIDRLARVVGDVLTVERMRGGRAETGERVSLPAVVLQAAPDATALAPSLELAVGDLPAAVVRATPWTVERALWAVLDNALKYTPAGGRVTLTVVEGAARAGIRVDDTGPGIPPEEQGRVFDRFYRGQAGRHLPGSGLGLAMARALVQYDGGTVEIQSEVGKGTTATLWWPLWRDGGGGPEAGAEGRDPAGPRS